MSLLQFFPRFYSCDLSYGEVPFALLPISQSTPDPMAVPDAKFDRRLLMETGNSHQRGPRYGSLNRRPGYHVGN